MDSEKIVDLAPEVIKNDLDREGYLCYVEACRELGAEEIKSFAEYMGHPIPAKPRRNFVRPQVNINIPNLPDGKRYLAYAILSFIILVFLTSRIDPGVHQTLNNLAQAIASIALVWNVVRFIDQTEYFERMYQKKYLPVKGPMAVIGCIALGIFAMVWNNTAIKGNRYVDPFVESAEAHGCVYKSSTVSDDDLRTEQAWLEFWSSEKDGAQILKTIVDEVEYPTRTEIMIRVDSHGSPFYSKDDFFAEVCGG